MLKMNKIAKIVLVIMFVMLFMSLVVSLFGGNSGGIYVPEKPDLNIDLDQYSIIL